MTERMPGHDHPFRLAHAASEDWRVALARCIDGLTGDGAPAGLGFLYVSDAFTGDLDAILGALKDATGIDDWVGSVGAGLLAEDTEYLDRPAIVAMTAPVPDGGYRLLPDDAPGTPIPPSSLAPPEPLGLPVAIVHADPRHPGVEAMLSDLAGETSAYLLGGLTAARGACYQIAGEVREGGVSGVLFGPGAGIQTGLTQGCVPLGPPHLVTEAAETVVMSLDGAPALDALRRDISGLDDDDAAALAGNLHAALLLAGSDQPDYMVRNLTGIDPDRGWIAIGDRVAAGERLVFVRRDAASAKADLAAALERIKGRLRAPPRAGLYFSCVGRGAGMFGRPGVEVAMIRQSLGRFPLAGMACAGEICNARLYGYTGVLAVFT